MKLITAYIKPYQLDNTREALLNVGIRGMTAIEVRGFGRQLGHTELYRGAEYAVDFIPKIKLEIMCRDDQKDLIINTLIEINKSNKIGAGKIRVSDIETLIRIRTGEMDEDAL
ncbi:MAG: P-II family nitrogen regulator [Francisellaceae bacterium]